MSPKKSHVGVVTGSATGIGQMFCTTLAAEGIAVVGIDIADQAQTAELVEAQGAAFNAHTANVSDLDAIRNSMDAAVTNMGHIDIVVANAGIYPAGPFEEVSLDEWQALMRVNLDGVFCTLQSALPHLRSNGWGRIVVVSSAAIWTGVPLQTAYVASKAALVGLVRSLAGEVAEDGITVNAISPGLTATEHVLNSWPGTLFETVIGMQAIKRRMVPEDLATSLLYLVDERSGFITGQTINVDGGTNKR